MSGEKGLRLFKQVGSSEVFLCMGVTSASLTGEEKGGGGEGEIEECGLEGVG